MDSDEVAGEPSDMDSREDVRPLRLVRCPDGVWRPAEDVDMNRLTTGEAPDGT